METPPEREGTELKGRYTPTYQSFADMLYSEPLPIYKIYRRRWLMLFIFCAISTTSAYQWLQFGSINKIIHRYYNVTPAQVDWLSMVYFLTYPVFVIPVSLYIARFGLRQTLLCGAFMNTAGAWIKVASAQPSLFFVTIAGQSISAVGQVFVIGLSAEMVVSWFGANEVSMVTTIAASANMLGAALGMGLAPVIVPEPDDITVLFNRTEYDADGNTTVWIFPPDTPEFDVTFNLQLLLISTALATFAVFLLTLFAFEGSPPVAPSAAEDHKDRYDGIVKKGSRLGKDLLQLVTSFDFQLLFFSYGVLVGANYATVTLLSQMVAVHYPDSIVEAGLLGCFIGVVGIVGAIGTGFWIDKTRLYRETYVCICFGSLVFFAVFALFISFELSFGLVIAAGLAYGAFSLSVMCFTLDAAAEYFYPISESLSSGLLLSSAQIMGLFFTIGSGYLLKNRSLHHTLIFLFGVNAFGFIASVAIKSETKRQEAEALARER